MSQPSSETPDGDVRGFSFSLIDSEQGLSLTAHHRPKFAPLLIDWSSPEQRRRVAGGKRQLLARAIGLHKHASLRVLDATGGLGRDAWTLAALGARVDLIERQPLLAALLQDAHRRALASEELRDVAERLSIREGDAATLLQTGERWDVVHLDPMYPDHGSSALPQKEMQMLRELTGGDADADALLLPALAVSQRRVVVKRPSHAPHLDNRKPDFQLSGTQARYDIYLPSAEP